MDWFYNTSSIVLKFLESQYVPERILAFTGLCIDCYYGYKIWSTVSMRLAVFTDIVLKDQIVFVLFWTFDCFLKVAYF